METTHLGLAMPKVLQQLKAMLINRGFEVQTLPIHNPVLVASQKGNWFRKSKQLVIEISSLENNITRIDITAILNYKSDSQEEEILEENFVTALYNNFKKVIKPSYGS